MDNRQNIWRLSQQEIPTTRNHGYDVYVKDLVNGRIAVSVTNRGGSEIVVPAINLTDIYLQSNVVYTAREVWSKKEANIKKVLNVGTLKPYETKVYVLAVNQ